MTPAVSILLPVFNAKATLAVCLRSIERQLEERWECVIVDDGSSDGTLALARAFAARDSRFRVVATAHSGLVTALNTGLDRCRASLVARMDADDVMHRARLGLQIAALSAPGLAAVGSHVRLFPRRTLRDGWRAYEQWLNGIDSAQRVRDEAYIECPVVHPTLMIRRDVLAAMRYRDCGWPEDYDLVLRLLGAGHEVGVVPRRLLAWRDSAARLSRTSGTYALDRLTACKAAFLADQLAGPDGRYAGRSSPTGSDPPTWWRSTPGGSGRRSTGQPSSPPRRSGRSRAGPSSSQSRVRARVARSGRR